MTTDTPRREAFEKIAREFLGAVESLCDWMNGNDLVADHAEQCPEGYQRLCDTMVAMQAALTPPATAGDWTGKERAAIDALMKDRELGEHQIVRQALALYQMHNERLNAGETCTYSGDAQRVRDFAGDLMLGLATVGDIFAGYVCRDVAELSDRTSPDGAPDMMLVTTDELTDIILRHFPPSAEAKPASSQHAFINEYGREVEIAVKDGVHIVINGPNSRTTIDLTPHEAGRLHDALGEYLSMDRALFIQHSALSTQRLRSTPQSVDYPEDSLVSVDDAEFGMKDHRVARSEPALGAPPSAEAKPGLTEACDHAWIMTRTRAGIDVAFCPECQSIRHAPTGANASRLTTGGQKS